MKFLALLLQIYSFVFHLTLSVFLLSSAAIANWTQRRLDLPMLPFDDDHLLRDTAVLGAFGVVCTLLAATRWFKFVFVVWTLLVLYLMVRGFFAIDSPFRPPQELRGAEWLTFGAVGAFFGAAWGFKMRRRLGFF